MKTLIRQIIFIIFGFLTLGCLAQDSLVNTFQLKSNNKIKTLRSKNEITIDSEWRWNLDSTQIDIEVRWGNAFYVLKDTLVVRPSRIYHQKFIYKDNPIRNVYWGKVKLCLNVNKPTKYLENHATMPF